MRDLVDGSKDVLHLGTGAEHLLESLAVEALLEGPMFLLELVNMQGTSQDHFQFFELNRLTEKIVRPLANRL